ncbi:hypothetical protein PENNAL_c0318G05113 [Penicillium nalgiovense]|uniref:Uncharacterized protein n=1 Tax=Penicillium nalgiovense TaxID=60175 RepID=A0A1V6WAV0_PENNA|nr:hypothetical protein PENNAL_c0318G05113 [Penicillium nalgiovense]
MVSDSENPIDAAATLALAQALKRAQRCLDMVQDKASELSQIVGVAERQDSILLDIKDLNREQWGSLENGALLSFYFCTAASWKALGYSMRVLRSYDLPRSQVPQVTIPPQTYPSFSIGKAVLLTATHVMFS